MERKAWRISIFSVVFIVVGALCVQGGLVAHWALDEDPGTSGLNSILDSGPSELYHGTPTFVEAPPVTFEQPGAADYTGTCAAFTGAAGIDVPYDPEINPESFTFCAWVLLETVGGYQSVVTSRHDNFPDLAGYILYCDPNGNWTFWTGRQGGWDGLAGGPALVGEWTHLAIVFDADTGTKSIYINGVGVSDTTQQYVPNQVRDLHLGSGGDFGTQYVFHGSIDDAALWSVALTEEQIVQVMEEGAGSVSEDMVAYWKLDEPADVSGAGAVVDSTGNGHDGDLPPPPFEPGSPGATENTGTSICFSNASIDVIYAPELNPESFTLALWAKPQVTAGFQSAVTNRYDINTGEETQGFVLYNDNNGNWAFWTGIGPTLGNPPWAVLAGPPVEVDAWQHVAISFDADTGTKAMYVNGELVASTTDQPYVPNTFRDLHIGGGGDMGDQYRFVGCLDDVALWDEALTAEQIQDVMENGITGGQPPAEVFVRGEANDDGQVNIADAIFILTFLFGGGEAPPCPDAADANDDGALNVADAIKLLGHLFGGEGPLPEPAGACGADPTGDSLEACNYTHCP